MPTAVADIRTELAGRYMIQLCKHFAHRIPATWSDDQGRIEFPAGLCRLAAAPGVLTLTAEAPDPAALEQVTDVVARHLVRFAFRDPPVIAWHAL